MKVDQFLGSCGYTSRRKAKVLIDEQRVTVNGKIANFSTKVKEGDSVSVDGEVIPFKTATPVFIAYHKPKGIICTSEKIPGNIIDAIQHKEKIYPVGRLDKDSEGLILLMNQGSLIDKISNAAFGHEKEYVVTLNLPVRKQFLKEISEGIALQGEQTKPCTVSLEPNAKRIFILCADSW